MTFGEVIKAGAAILDGIPMGAIIKAAVAVGITVFTAWVLIKRTKKMHEEAEKGKASHETYKEGLGKLSEVFRVENEDFSQLNIPGFTGYQRDQDVDGVHWSKEFFDRRLSSTLVPKD